MHLGIITYATENYFDTCLKLIDSILEFSSLPITVYTIGFKAEHINSRVKIVFVEKEPLFNTWQTNCFYKQLVCSTSPYEVSIFLDTDTVITPLFEDFFKSRYKNILNSHTILGTKHPSDPSTDVNNPNRPLINSFFNIFNVQEVPGYIQACAYAFNNKLLHIFKKIYKINVSLAVNKIIPAAGDEQVLNLFLHKRNLLKQADCGLFICPIFPTSFFKEKIKNESLVEHLNRIKDPCCHEVIPIMFHGTKEPENAQYIIDCVRDYFLLK